MSVLTWLSYPLRACTHFLTQMDDWHTTRVYGPQICCPRPRKGKWVPKACTVLVVYVHTSLLKWPAHTHIHTCTQTRHTHAHIHNVHRMRCTHIHTCVRCMHTCCVAHTTRITFQKVNKRNLYSNLSPSRHTRNLHYFVSFPFISLLQSLGCAPRVMFPWMSM